MSKDLEYWAAKRRADRAAEQARKPPRHTWVSGKVTQVTPPRVSTSDWDSAGHPATNMTNGPLHIGQPVMLMLVDGGTRLIMGARYAP